jgi:hypothetical protein
MEFEQSALMFEVNQIMNAGPKPVQWQINAQVTVNTNNQTYTPLKILQQDTRRNYMDGYSDEQIITMVFPAGTYATQIYPYKNNLDVTVVMQPMLETGDQVDTSQSPVSETYTATILDTGDPTKEQTGFNAATQYNMDLTSQVTVHFQLLNKALDQMRMIDVGQVFRGATVGQAIQTMLTNASQTTTVNGQRTVQGVTMTAPANTQARTHIVLPHGVKLVDAAKYIQKYAGGVYNSGMGCYLQGNQWHVFPSLDTTRFNTSQNTLTVINLPQNKYTNVERTYRQAGGQLVVLATGNVKFRDPSNAHQLNAGNGVRFSDATKFMGSFAQLGDNKALASRGANNNEFVGLQRPDGNNNVHRSSNPINANSLEEYSKLARAMGSVIQMEWQHSNPELITPGLPVQVLYLEEDQIQTITGVVVGAHHFTQMVGHGFSTARYGTSSVLAIFIQPADQSTSTTP